MSTTGWVKLHRKLRDNPFMRRPAYRSVWVELLLEAQHGMKSVNGKWVPRAEDELKVVVWKGEKIRLKPGQLTLGMKQLSEWTGVPRGTCERIIKCFKNEEMIEEQTSNQFSLILIKNWREYQEGEEQVEEQMRNKRGTDEERMRTPRECKNEENEENERIQATPPAIADETKISITKVLEAFQMKLNPGIQYGNKTQRAAAEHLIKAYGLEKVLRTIDYVVSIKDEQFAPTVTTPYQLKEKMAALTQYYGKNTKSKNNVLVIS